MTVRSSSILRTLPAFLLALVPCASNADEGVRAKPVTPIVTAGMPSEFANLSQSQQVVADVYFGGRRIGQFEVEASPGRVLILHPDRIATAVPDLIDATRLTKALSGDLDPNARFLCVDPGTPCQPPQPDVAAIVFDQQRFRLDLFVNPNLLAVRAVTAERFLTPFTSGISVIDTIGGAIAGGSRQSPAYSLRNRVIVGAGAARLMSESSVSSGRGANLDTLVAQLDRPNLRYAAGLFYAPGADLVGRRRILGLGIGSQFDTRADRQQLSGSPLIVFLTQRSRVDLFSEGRLMSSRTFEAGNQALDTSALPDGSYPVEIRIEEASGAKRTERRFFTKNNALAPIGHLAFFANAGALAVDRGNSIVGFARTPLLSAGLAGRVGLHIAWDATLMATDGKALGEIGMTWLTPIAQARLAALGSSTGDYGVVAQAGSTTGGALSYNFDLRYVHSGDGHASIPLDDFSSDPFSSVDLSAQRSEFTGTSFVQMVGNISYHLGEMQVGMSGYYRHDRSSNAAYAVGPTARWSILHRERLRLTVDGSYARTNRGAAAAFGLQLQIFGRSASISARAGAQTGFGREGKGLGDVEEISASIQRQNVLGGDLTGSTVIQHGDGNTVLQAAVDQRGPAGFGSASLVRRIGTDSNATQYGLTMQTSLAIGHDTLRVGAREQNDSIVSVGIRGSARATKFEVLIDDSPRGVVTAGDRAVFAVMPYRRYKVRVRPVGEGLIAFDTRTRSVDVYPGTVASLDWKADPVLAMFGRLVRSDGTPVADSDITTDGAISATDARGYFQLQAAQDALIVAHGADGRSCSVKLDAKPATTAYTALGDLACKPS